MENFLLRAAVRHCGAYSWLIAFNKHDFIVPWNSFVQYNNSVMEKRVYRFCSRCLCYKDGAQGQYATGTAEATENRLHLRSELPNRGASFSSLTAQKNKLLTIRQPNVWVNSLVIFAPDPWNSPDQPTLFIKLLTLGFWTPYVQLARKSSKISLKD